MLLRKQFGWVIDLKILVTSDWKQLQFMRIIKLASKLQRMIWFRFKQSISNFAPLLLPTCQFGEVKLIYCPTEVMLADALTKALIQVCKICNIDSDSTQTTRSEREYWRSSKCYSTRTQATAYKLKAGIRLWINPRRQGLIQMTRYNTSFISSNLTQITIQDYRSSVSWARGRLEGSKRSWEPCHRLAVSVNTSNKKKWHWEEVRVLFRNLSTEEVIDSVCLSFTVSALGVGTPERWPLRGFARMKFRIAGCYPGFSAGRR